MSTKTETTKKKGRLSWLITVLELIIIIVYFIIGFGGIMDAFKHMDFVGMFESVETAIIFLLIAIAVVTILCFIPIFKSKGNVRWAIWNIIWIIFTVSELF